jgi:hypothetical protein
VDNGEPIAYKESSPQRGKLRGRKKWQRKP